MQIFSYWTVGKICTTSEWWVCNCSVDLKGRGWRERESDQPKTWKVPFVYQPDGAADMNRVRMNGVTWRCSKTTFAFEVFLLKLFFWGFLFVVVFCLSVLVFFIFFISTLYNCVLIFVFFKRFFLFSYVFFMTAIIWDLFGWFLFSFYLWVYFLLYFLCLGNLHLSLYFLLPFWFLFFGVISLGFLF